MQSPCVRVRDVDGKGSRRHRLRTMFPRPLLSLASLFGVGLSASTLLAADTAPAVVTPGVQGAPPSDAIVLFNGKDLSAWKSGNGGAPQWPVRDGYFEVGKGNLITREEFGPIQLHIEWASPAEVKGEGQGRGNSGVYFQGRYEIQVLDSYQNPTYSNGQASSFYGFSAPLVNASRKPGEWQTYDIDFTPAVLDGTIAIRNRTACDLPAVARKGHRLDDRCSRVESDKNVARHAVSTPCISATPLARSKTCIMRPGSS